MKPLKKILIADDNPVNLKVLKVSLEAEGIGVLSAVNGLEALAILGTDMVDGIISDVLMPTMDGYRFCCKVRGEESLRHLPFILYSSTHFTADDEKIALHYGADRFFRKPTPLKELIQAINDVRASRSSAPMMPVPPPSELETLKEYSEALIHKLEKKNKELVEEKERFRKLSEELDQRVKERTAELESSNRELEAFSYSVSHDLRAPLRALDGFSLAILEGCEGKLDEKNRSYLQRLREASAQMGRLIEDLLKLSKVSRGEMQRETVSLSAIAKEIVKELRDFDPVRRVSFTIEEEVNARGDGRLLRIVLENLLRNAWKYTSKRAEAHISFGVLKRDEPVFFVRDDGAGFDMRHAGKLFGAFQRLHRADEFPGTGIGLATVQRIVHRHGGKVWAQGEVEKGASFFFTLPGFREGDPPPLGKKDGGSG